MPKQSHRRFVTHLFQRYELLLRRFLLKKSRYSDDVDDLLQETFLKAYRVKDWARVENPEAYLVRIASNAYKNDARKKGQGNMVDRSIDINNFDIGDAAPSPEEIAAGRQNLNEFEKVANSLTPRVRQAVILIKMMNIPYPEASEIMGISVTTLEKHVTRGMAECRRKIQTQAGYEGLRPYVEKVVSLSTYKKAEH
ncbi:MAG: RNA polymerase sigma factor [Spongiibacteraceae bacterium]|nr:RNA polymerase sigma factor [Spongiibacteraceae bacterium]